MAIIRTILGRPSLGKMDNLETLLRTTVSESDFNNYRNLFKYCYIGTVNFNTGGRIYTDITKVDYEEAISIIMASASVPVFAEPVPTAGGDYLYDGGVRDHIGSPWLIQNHHSEIDSIVSIYSRPRDYDISNDEWEPSNVLKVLNRTIDIMNMEISKNDEIKEISLCRRHKIDRSTVYLPSVLTSMYDTDRERLEDLYVEGRLLGSRLAL